MKILKYKNKLLIASLALMLVSIGALNFFSLNLSNDFTGGSVFVYNIVDENFDVETLRNDIPEVYSEFSAAIESVNISENTVTISSDPVSVENQAKITEKLNEKIGVELNSSETIGSVIGSETLKKSFTALALALGMILVYIAFAFRNVPKPYSSYKFGVSAIIAMIHDVIIVLGIFSALGKFLNVEIDVMFITAMLTVIGFSVHDSIVVFDRIRENLKRLRKKNLGFEGVVDISIQETMRRSVFTSLTVVVILASLFMLGGASLKYFVLALLVGIILGTYSSIFVASPILVILESGKTKERIRIKSSTKVKKRSSRKKKSKKKKRK